MAGMVFVSDIEKSGVAFNLMKDRVNVEAFKQALVADDFGLISLPEELWRPRLAVPPELVNPAPPEAEPEEIAVGE